MQEVQLSLTAEQQDLRGELHTFLDRNFGEAALREFIDDKTSDSPATLWRRLSDELGLAGLIVAERDGGAGLGLPELVIVSEEFGRALYPGPFLSSAVLATSAIAASEDRSAIQRYLPDLARGNLVATLALSESQLGWPIAPRTRAVIDGGRARVSGVKRFVLDAEAAGLILVVADTAGGIALLAVDPAQPGVRIESLQLFDRTRRLAHLRLEDATAEVIGSPGGGQEIVEIAVGIGALALAAEAIGGAQHVLDASVQYARDRFQFGRPIGSFQAIKHKCVNMLIKVESARSAVYNAAAEVQNGSSQRKLMVSSALAAAGEAYLYVAGENIQIHGGIGMTWEHGAHLHFRRATVTTQLLGNPAFHRQRIADAILEAMSAQIVSLG